MNACITAVLAILMIALTPFAHVALGQSVINGGVSTQTVVNPSVLPDSLPIGSEQAVMDWVVTNRQWYGNARPLSAFTVISVRYTGTNKIQGARSFGLTDYEFTSYKDFEFCIGKFGMELVEKIKSDPRVDHSIPLSMYAYHAYTDVNAETGPMGIYLSKDLGLARDVSQDSFLDFKIFSQVVVRIPNLEKFEVEVDGDKPYHFSWTSQSKKPATSGTPAPEEMTTKDFIVMQSWYSYGTTTARFKVTTGGVTRVYSEQGSLIVPPVLTLSGFGVNVEFTRGRKTIVETSTNLKDWSEIMTIPEDIETNSIWIPYYPGSSSTILPKRFFRAKSL